MSSIGFYANEGGRCTGLSRLQGRCKFKRVGRNHTVVMVAGGYQRGGIGCAGLNVVQWRVSEQGVKHLRALVTAAIIKRPACPGSKFVIAQHVQDANAG